MGPEAGWGLVGGESEPHRAVEVIPIDSFFMKNHESGSVILRSLPHHRAAKESDRIEHLSPTATVQHSQPDYGDLGKQR